MGKITYYRHVVCSLVWCPVIFLILAVLDWGSHSSSPPPELLASREYCIFNLLLSSQPRYLFLFSLSILFFTHSLTFCLTLQRQQYRFLYRLLRSHRSKVTLPSCPNEHPLRRNSDFTKKIKIKKTITTPGLNCLLSFPLSFSKHIAKTIASDLDRFPCFVALRVASVAIPNIPNKYPIHFAGVGWHPP